MQKLQFHNPSKKGVPLFMWMLNIFSIILFMWKHSWTTRLKICISFRSKGIVLKYFSSNLSCLKIVYSRPITKGNDNNTADTYLCVLCLFFSYFCLFFYKAPWEAASKPEFIQRVNNKKLASQILLRFWSTTDYLKGFGRLYLLLSLRRKVICYSFKCIQAYKTTSLQGWLFFVSDIMPNSDIWERACLRWSINEELLREIPDNV